MDLEKAVDNYHKVLNSTKPLEPKQGLRYNQGKRKWGMVDFKSLEPMVEVLEYGAHKYTIYEDQDGNEIKGVDIPIQDAHKYKVKLSGVNNWKKGLNKVEILESMMRHLAALIDDESHDKESGIHHMGHIQCNALFYNYMIRNYEED